MNLRNKLPFFLKYSQRKPDQPIWLEYLEFDGQSWIDTGIAYQDCRIDCVAKLENTGQRQFLGGWSHSPGHYIAVNTSNKYELGGSSAVLADSNATEQTNLVANKTETQMTLTINGVSVSRSIFDTLPSTDYRLGNIFSGTYSGPIKGAIYRHAFYNADGELIQDLRPCLHPQTFEPCMYDMVSKQYFYNAGTGSFAYEYTFSELDYIESTGTQYIDTGIIMNQDTSVLLDFQYTGTSPSNRLFGSRIGYATYGEYGLLFATTNQTSGDYYIQWANEQHFTGIEQDFNRHKWNIQKNIAYFDGLLVKEFTYKEFSTTQPALLFGGYHSSSVLTCSARVYSCQIFDNGVLACDLIPVRKVDGTVCMYDFISGEFKTNAGTGQFKASTKLFMPEPQKISAWINEAGLWIAASSANYSVVFPVTAGKRYTLSFDNTESTVVGTIFRWGFTDNPNPVGQTLSNFVRTTPQETPVATIEAIAPYGTKTPYMVVQVGSTYGETTFKEHLYLDVGK